MNEIEILKDLMLTEVALIDSTIESDLESLDEQLDPLLDEVLRYSLFNGGKRIRPLLVILASRICGGDESKLYRLSIAFEYLHVATLLHDDVIDQADTRRGKPSVNKEFGLVAAILAGDFLHARAMTLVGELSGQTGLSIFSEATQGMVDGEFVQLRNCEQYELSEENYFDAIQGKTAQLISASCEIGAVYANATKEQQMVLRFYGSNLGAAFQIVDDLLDYLGDAKDTGKKIGNDLIEGKVTLPLILALRNAGKKDDEKLLKFLNSEDARQTKFIEIVELVSEYGGFEESKQRAESLIQEALHKLILFKGSNVVAVEILTGLAGYVLARNK